MIRRCEKCFRISLAAVNEVCASAIAENEMGNGTGGLNIPGLEAERRSDEYPPLNKLMSCLALPGVAARHGSV